MKEISYYINPLQNQRYFITMTINGSQVTHNADSTSLTWLNSMNTTYRELLTLLEKHFDISDESNPTAKPANLQTFRNHASTLKTFLATTGKTIDSRIGEELSSGHTTALQNYFDSIQVAERTKRDRRAHLNLMCRLFNELREGSTNKVSNKESNLANAIRMAVSRSGVAPKALAQRIGISPSAIQRWLKGAQPNERGISTLRRLEQALNQPRDSFVNLLEKAEKTSQLMQNGITYRSTLRERNLDTYSLKEVDLAIELRMEWTKYFKEKTTTAPQLERNSNSSWRLVPLEVNSKPSPLTIRGNSYSPTANIALNNLRRFLGWLVRTTEKNGFGATTNQANTLAWLALPDVVTEYLEFITERSCGIKHNGQRVFARWIASLTREKTGYLWQQPQFRHCLPNAISPCSDTAWKDICKKTHSTARDWILKSRGVSRIPEEPIANLLALEHPLLPALDAIKAIEQLAAEAPGGSLEEARHRRDALLISIIITNPLRRRTLQTLKWNRDNSGSVYRSASGGWRIRLTTSSLKNGDSQVGEKYDVGIPEWVGQQIDNYVHEFRETLLDGANSKYFFISSRQVGVWNEMSRHVFLLTRRHIKISSGFGTQAFRHLVATAWLKKHPGDFLTVAELLNDKLATVMDNYAHLKRDTSLARLAEHIELIRNG
jgi:transcriptional regulator with XRE-family HTH domain/integrase